MRPAHTLRRVVRAATPGLALGLAGLAVACADGPTAPGAASAAAPAAAHAKGAAPTVASSAAAHWLDGTTATRLKATQSGVQAQYTVGDTVVTLVQAGTQHTGSSAFNIGLSGRLELPDGARSVCNPRTSGYGPGTWDAPCTPSAQPVRIAVRTWVDAAGRVVTDFEPALRFVPDAGQGVTLTLKDAALAGTRVDYCSAGRCVDEAASDPSLATRLDGPNGFVVRRIKHFSGYVVVANRSGSYGEY